MRLVGQRLHGRHVPALAPSLQHIRGHHWQCGALPIVLFVLSLLRLLLLLDAGLRG